MRGKFISETELGEDRPKWKSRYFNGGPASVTKSSVGRNSARPTASARANKKVAKGRCTWCRRPFSILNPIRIKRVKVPNLPCRKGYGHCDICDGAKRWVSLPLSDKQHGLELTDDKKQEAWMKNVRAYENYKNKDSVEDLPGFAENKPESRDGPLTVISREHLEALVATVHVRNFWPKDVYEANAEISKPATSPIFTSGLDAFGVQLSFACTVVFGLLSLVFEN